ncbi:glycosyltransferase family protein [Aestuariibaculum lutulentum]|uniref:UDP-glycosyltransferase n=1 Tax=Aestuariibaculum lutulentum TaxID=2920935 RepID=A0ABS9RE51_9FLAO|nr:UDP-glycosyltransferase [Aestuariibaculum lutulentum]MCH4551229.1 UDP-glycosyltransferase [Aestuariibaculum lutulentum]
MKHNKVFVLLPDGIGLRNFVFSSFPAIGDHMGFEVTYWNQTSFDLSELGCRDLKLYGKASSKTDLYKRARKEIELKKFEGQFQDDIYRKYSFKPLITTLKQRIKKGLVQYYILKYKGNKLSRLRDKIKASERKTAFYKSCVETLKKEKPDFVFCTNQRPVNAISPILAAQDVGIPTATFIFSWDNVPKATMVLETDYYFVWSVHMKNELLTYYPYINEAQIHVTGTPQFECHFQKELVLSKDEFINWNNLPKGVDYICFSGDDVTTSPYDPQYLEATAKAVRQLNDKGYNIVILFRKCPVDFSNRFDLVLKTYKDVVYEVSPKWEKRGVYWNEIMPLKEDVLQLFNTIYYSKLVINVGSSMVFDFICHNKPCAYMNYNPKAIENLKDIHTIYKYVHFRSMPTRESVVWLNNSDMISEQLETMLNDENQTVLSSAKKWFNIIAGEEPQRASENIWKTIKGILNA